MGAGFETKDSGERVTFATGMRRDVEARKPRFDLVCPFGVEFDELLLTRWAALMGRGAEKYGDRNWEKAETAEEFERFRSSAFRHFMQWMCGTRDEDHAAAVLFNLQGAEYVRSRMQEKAPASGPADLSRFWSELSDWSQATFGTDADRGPAGPLAHLTREVQECQDHPDDLTEYADLLFLVFDACRRAGFTYDELVFEVFDKLAVNRARKWGRPDAEGVCEHVRGPGG